MDRYGKGAKEFQENNDLMTKKSFSLQFLQRKYTHHLMEETLKM